MEEENWLKKEQEKRAYLAELDRQRFEKMNKKLSEETKKWEEQILIKQEEEKLK
jgi:hypothetical protein